MREKGGEGVCLVKKKNAVSLKMTECKRTHSIISYIIIVPCVGVKSLRKNHR